MQSAIGEHGQDGGAVADGARHLQTLGGLILGEVQLADAEVAHGGVAIGKMEPAGLGLGEHLDGAGDGEVGFGVRADRLGTDDVVRHTTERTQLHVTHPLQGAGRRGQGGLTARVIYHSRASYSSDI